VRLDCGCVVVGTRQMAWCAAHRPVALAVRARPARGRAAGGRTDGTDGTDGAAPKRALALVERLRGRLRERAREVQGLRQRLRRLAETQARRARRRLERRGAGGFLCVRGAGRE
jgi:hypothetical protein